MPPVSLSASQVSTASSSILLHGGCVTGYLVTLSGDASDFNSCQNGVFDFTLAQSVDGTYRYALTQTDSTGNSSVPTSFTWTRDTRMPPEPVISSPDYSPYTSNSGTLSVEGTCSDEYMVELSGTETQLKPCQGGAFRFTLNRSADGTYGFSVAQVNSLGVRSPAAVLAWTLDTSPPSAPLVTSPPSNPFTSADDSVTLRGSCEQKATITVYGDGSAEDLCGADGTFSIPVSKSADGSYLLRVMQIDQAGNMSTPAVFQWIRDTSIPAAPQITAPTTSPYYSSTSTVSLSGNCTPGYSVRLSGADTQQTSCSTGTFRFDLSKTADGTYNLSVLQVSPAAIASAATSFIWVKDSVAPAPVVVLSPASNPYVSADNMLSLSGSCESGATVNLSGAASATVACASSKFSFLLAQSQDGLYLYQVKQVDRGGNQSTSVDFSWEHDSSIPPTPVIMSPALGRADTSGSSLRISGSCESDNVVSLGRDDAQQALCVSSAFAFTVSKAADGAYSFTVHQTTPAGIDSAQTTISWVRDTVAPPTPTISSPAANPFTSGGSSLAISGSCEAGATVNLSGGSTQSGACDGGTYLFSIHRTVDGTYDFELSQIDLAGNASGAVALRWVRDNSLPPTPTILSPAANPMMSSSSSILVSGDCKDSFAVTLGGDVAASEVLEGNLTQACNGSSYSFTVAKAADGVYSFSVSQAAAGGTSSASAWTSWIRDTLPPVTTFIQTPPADNLASTANFSFAANESGVTYSCALDQGAFASCASPVTLSGLLNRTHSFHVLATDAAGNVARSPATFSWAQQTFNTIALYHFDTNPGTTADSGLYAGTLDNDLTTNTTVAGTSVLFGQSRRFVSSSSQYMSAAHNVSQNLGISTMTIETFASLASLPSSGTHFVVARKSGSAGQYGWELKIKRVGSKYYLAFAASLNGSAVSEVRSAPINLGTNAFRHLAVTWNRGAVKFYYDGVAAGSASIGSVGLASIFASNAPVVLGAGLSGGYLNGTLDEFRISQVVRWTSSFSRPSSPYVAD